MVKLCYSQLASPCPHLFSQFNRGLITQLLKQERSIFTPWTSNIVTALLFNWKTIWLYMKMSQKWNFFYSYRRAAEQYKWFENLHVVLRVTMWLTTGSFHIKSTQKRTFPFPHLQNWIIFLKIAIPMGIDNPTKFCSSWPLHFWD